MKHFGWIIAGVVLIWYFFFRQTIILTGANGSTSGGILTGGTASPTGGTMPLSVIDQGTSGGSPVPGISYYGTSRTGSTIIGAGPRIPSAPIARGYYLPPALVPHA